MSKLQRAILAQVALTVGLVALGLFTGIGWWPGALGGVIGLVGILRKPEHRRGSIRPDQDTEQQRPIS